MADDIGQAPWHLSGNWAPRQDEVTETNLEIEGEIPHHLNGTYIRTGPNPKSGNSPHWFLGDGMIHGIRLCDGKAEWYRNAFIQTTSLGVPFGASGNPRDINNSKANTHILQHGDKVLALYETGLPWRIDQDLNTVGIETFGGGLQTAMTAHPKVCPVTGELMAFSYAEMQEPLLRYVRIGKDGEVKQTEGIDIPRIVMMHDFAITRNYSIFLDLPVCFDLNLLATGMPFEFKPDAGARIGVMPRAGGNGDVRWFEIPPCFVFHTVNAHEVGSKIVLTASRLKAAFQGTPDDFANVGYLWRWTLDLETGAVQEEQLDDRSGDFARVNSSRVGLEARFGYLMSMAGEGEGGEPIYGSELLKYDLQSGGCKVHRLGDTVRGGEPTFVSTGAEEDQGYVMTFCHDEATGQSTFIIVDAQDFDAAPVATIRLPHRVPYGAHGNWIPLS